MKKCFILLAILITVLTVSILIDEIYDELPENTLAISKIGSENSVLQDKNGE